ncbi:MAG: transposase [Anaerolineae bacterium]
MRHTPIFSSSIYPLPCPLPPARDLTGLVYHISPYWHPHYSDVQPSKLQWAADDRSGLAIGRLDFRFAWLGRYRRLSKDYEQLPETSEAMIYAAMVHVMLRRLARNPAVAFL